MNTSSHEFTRQIQSSQTHTENLLIVDPQGTIERFKLTKTEVSEQQELYTLDSETVERYISQEEARLVDTNALLRRAHKVGLKAGGIALGLSLLNELSNHNGIVASTGVAALTGGGIYAMIGQLYPRAVISFNIKPTNTDTLRRINILQNINTQSDKN